jgi:ABC-type lipoprotein export system ATPase subunit
MFKLKNVEIWGFWGKHKVTTGIYNDVNIFIGKNGTGKTTFINILQAALTVDIELLYNLQYEKMVLNLIDGKRKRKIEISKISDDLEYSSVEYKIGTKKYPLPIVPYSDVLSKRFKTGRLNPKFFRMVQEIREQINYFIRISYLSVYRENLIKDDFLVESRREIISNTIDSKLNDLIGDLTSFQLQLETELTRLSMSFQENVLRTMLFNEEFDYVNISEPIKLNIKEIRVGLKQAYRELGILDKNTAKIIEKHVKTISTAADSINKHVEDREKPLYPNDVTPLTLLKRTRKIIKLSSELEENKKLIFKPISDYLGILNEFSDKKEFAIDESSSDGILVSKGGAPIPIQQLSSGEKQLIILLTETLLQKESKTIFIADEPELSLHIEWQRKIIPSIRKLNPNAQIIVATHSPEIVGKWKNNAINMESIIDG